MREIRTRQIVRDTALKLDQSKIYVNVDGIRRALDVEMRENWARYKFMVENGGDLDFSDAEKLLISSIDEKPVVMVRVKTSPSERYALFKRIVSEVRDQFTFNKEYGLNSNLSANIRHGYVLRELRGPLVNRNLVTNLISGERGYHPNSYWAERLEGLGLDDLDTLATFQREMSAFSEAVDRAIERLNRHLLRIRSEASPQGLFNYNLSDSALTVLDGRWGELETYDEFMDSIFDSMWTATEHNLKNVRAELGTRVLQHFISEIDALSERLDGLGITRAVPTISDAITMAKTDMRAAVDRVASWFTLSPHHEYADFDLEIPLRAGLATVAATETHLELDHSYLAKPASIMMQGWSLPSFGRLFFQLLDNAAKHGGHGRNELRISVSAEAEGGSLLIRVENDLPDDADLEHLTERVAQLNAEYGQAKALDMIGEEGGSGYSKVWKLIRADLKRDAHDISVEIVDRSFVVSILMNSGGLVCRAS
jgi:signal transduction histidine kinase